MNIIIYPCPFPAMLILAILIILAAIAGLAVYLYNKKGA